MVWRHGQHSAAGSERRRAIAGLLFFLSAGPAGALSTQQAPAPLLARTPATAEDPVLRCREKAVLCVDDEAGPTREYKTIQKAVNRAAAGDTVLVFDGVYSGFRITGSGKKNRPINIRAAGEHVIVNRPEPWGSGDMIYIENASYVVLEGFKIDAREGYGYGIGAHDARTYDPMRGLLIRHNEVFGAHSTNIYLSQVADSLIEGNRVHGSEESHGIYLANSGSKRTVIRANDVFDNGVNGLHFNGDASVGGDGIHSDLVIEDNVIHGNKANGIDMDGVQYSTILNNMIYDNGRHAIRAFQIDAAQGPRGLKIINNTCIVGVEYGWGIKLTQDLGDHTIFNNILAISPPAEGSIYADSGLLFSDANLVDGRFSLGGGDEVTLGLKQWHADGNDAHTLIAAADRIFIDPARGDYRLRSDSPAIDRGLASFGSGEAPPRDIHHTARPQGRGYDIGAVEYKQGAAD